MNAYRLLQAQAQPEFQEVPEPHAGPGQALDAAKQAYDDFEHGRLVGRGVLIPGLETARGSPAASSQTTEVAAGA